MSARPRLGVLAFAAVLAAADDGPASAVGPNSTLLLSRPSGLGALPVPGDGPSTTGFRSVSSDGRLIVFSSSADDLGVGDTLLHVWVRDTVADTTQLVDRVPGGGAPGNGFAGNASISRDGSTVCFVSDATNLVAGATGSHVFVVTLSSGAIQVADRTSGAPGVLGNGNAERCSLDATGSRVVFDSLATNLVPGDTNGATDVFLRVLGTATTTRVSLTQGSAEAPSGGRSGVISGDGLKIAFDTDDALIAGDTNDDRDVYVLNTQNSAVVRASVGTGGVQAMGDSSDAAIDDSGGHVAFASNASNLDLGGDGNGVTDVFWRDLTGSDTTILVSRATGGGAIGNDDSSRPDISGDGVGVAFESQATNLGAGPPPPPPFGLWVYLRRLGTNETSLLSRATGAAGAPADSGAGSVSLGGTPAVTVWTSFASNLDPAASGDFTQVFKRDLSGTPTTSLVSRPPGGGSRSAGVNHSLLSPTGAISADARLVVFSSNADSLDPAGASRTLQVFLRDVAADTTTLVSRGPGPSGAVANNFSPVGSVAAGGTHVAFLSLATNLLPGVGPAEVGAGQVYVRELATGNLELASRGDGVDGEPATELSGFFDAIGLSADGRRVAFTTGDDLVAADTNGRNDVYVRDLVAGTTTLASVTAGGVAGDNDSFTPSLSADGMRVAFVSQATDLLAAEPTTDTHVYVRDLVAGTTVLVDRTEAGTPGTGFVRAPQISGAGTRVAFRADDPLTSDPVPPTGALYVRDLVSQTTLIAGRADGAAGALATRLSEYSINHDGTRVSWTGSGAGLPGGPDTEHVFLRDLGANTTRLVSAADGTTDVLANDFVFTSAIDAGGGCVAFVSNANNLTTPAYPSRDFQHVYLRAVDGNCPIAATTPTTTSTTSTTLPSSSRTPISANAVVLKPGKLAKLVAKGLVLDLVDPTTAGGTLAVVGTTGSASYALPASGWKAVGKRQPKGFKFKGAGCRGSLLRKKIKVRCRGNTGSLSLPEPGPVDIELTVNGAGSYCTQCGGTAAGKATRVFKRKRCPAPAACP